MDPNHRQKGLKTGAKLLLVALLMPVVFAVLVYFFVINPFGGGVAAELRLADETEYRIVQKYQSWSEPYAVSFETRKPGEDWTWNYIDHEAWLWKKVEITHDEAADQIVVTERGKKRAVFDRGKSTFWFDKRDYRGTNPVSIEQ